MERRDRRSLTVLVGVIMASSAAQATVLAPMALEDMVRDSRGVVRARVTGSGVQIQFRGQGADPTTITRLQVEEWVVGS